MLPNVSPDVHRRVKGNNKGDRITDNGLTAGVYTSGRGECAPYVYTSRPSDRLVEQDEKKKREIPKRGSMTCLLLHPLLTSSAAAAPVKSPSLELIDTSTVESTVREGTRKNGIACHTRVIQSGRRQLMATNTRAELAMSPKGLFLSCFFFVFFMNQPLLYYADTGCHAARDALIVGRQPFRLIHGDPTDNTPLNKCLISETSIIEAIKFSNLALKLKAMKIFKSFFFLRIVLRQAKYGRASDGPTFICPSL